MHTLPNILRCWWCEHSRLLNTSPCVDDQILLILSSGLRLIIRTSNEIRHISTGIGYDVRRWTIGLVWDHPRRIVISKTGLKSVLNMSSRPLITEFAKPSYGHQKASNSVARMNPMCDLAMKRTSVST